MAVKPKGEIMSPNEMVEYGRQKRATSSIYKAESAEINDKAISQTVLRGLAEIVNADSGTKIDLSNGEQVKAVSKAYIASCADASCLPSIAGLARAMGCDRTTLYQWMKRRDTETGQWLMICHDLFSDLLAEVALKNNCNSIVSIFLQKAMYGLSETDNIVVRSQVQEFNDNDYSYSGSDDYKEKYRKMIATE